MGFENNEQKSPVGETVYYETSTDGSVALQVIREDTADDFITHEFGAMGRIIVYDSHSGEVFHEERTAISSQAIFGPGPTQDEANKWYLLVSEYSDGE